MNLLELCEPLFQYACRLNQRALLGDRPDPLQVDMEVESILSDLRTRAARTPGLADQYERVEMPLIFFVDNMIGESALPFAREWVPLAAKRGEESGDERFFEMLDDELRAPAKSTQVGERLAVYYVCMGLGYTGWYMGEPEVLRRYMRQLEPRVRPFMDAGGPTARERVTPEAYAFTRKDDLTEPPAKPLTKIVVAVVVLLAVVFIGNAYLYNLRTAQLKASLQKVIDQAGGQR